MNLVTEQDINEDKKLCCADGHPIRVIDQLGPSKEYVAIRTVDGVESVIVFPLGDTSGVYVKPELITRYLVIYEHDGEVVVSKPQTASDLPALIYTLTTAQIEIIDVKKFTYHK